MQKLIALGEHHQKEIQALKEQHAQELLERDRELNALKEEHERQMWLIDVGNMVMQHEKLSFLYLSTFYYINHLRGCSSKFKRAGSHQQV